MILKVSKSVHDADNFTADAKIEILNAKLKDQNVLLDCPDSIAYSPFINCHDHLIGNWYPKAGKNKTYPNSDIWVDDMKTSDSYLERNKVWINDGKWKLMEGNARLLIGLGIYKNIFSGCNVVQDHGPNQSDEYYQQFPIEVVKQYRQCHSLTIGNWWGGKSAIDEWKAAKNEMPFIIHLAEGLDEQAKKDFSKLQNEGLLQPNTLIIHGIALTGKEIELCAKAGTSICFCPGSNLFLIGKIIDLEKCLESKVNITIGTDSTMSGSINILAELKLVHELHPEIPMKELYRMITTNAQKALFLPDSYGKLADKSPHLLLVRKKVDDPFNNLLKIDTTDIELMIHNGIPIYGNKKYLQKFLFDNDDYFYFKIGNTEKFVIGHPEKIVNKIDSILGYHKKFPYFPFS
ncbi:MAG: amidohydrolase family protein [Candidatus Cloacimonetes bacterium]|nr:amidohydrolase family protein [Candidatus Cloacimonadota bacterium]